MDFKSFYRKIDVDSFKNRLPPMPQIKIPKIKSRKIFKSSREDLAQQQPPVGGGGAPMTPQSLPPPSAFIDRTPTRISTVSSLMDINYGFRDKHQSGLSTYRAASTFEEENCPDNGDAAAESGNAATRFGDKCRKTYKDLSEFKIKNIFAKKTVVKRTEIEVDIYARQYELELQQEQEELENQLVERGYDFEFKEARRRMSRSSGSISPPDSMASGVPSPIRSELGHLQRNNTPPMLARRRNAIDEAGPSRFHFHRSMSDESAGKPPKKPNRSSLWGLNESSAGDDFPGTLPSAYRSGISKLGAFRKSRKEGSTETPSAAAESVWKMKSIRARFASEDSGTERKAKKSMRQQESIDEPTEPTESSHEKKRWTLRSMNLRNSEAEKSNEPHMSSPEGKFSSIKQSIKRMKERKSQRENSEESEHDQTEAPTKSNVSTQLKAGLRRLKLRERSFTFDEEEGQPPQPATNKLRDWKKSFKTKRPSESATDEEAPARAAPHGRSSTLMRKLHHIRNKKVGSQDGDDTGDPSPTDDQHKPKSSNMEKLEHAREKAMKKMNAQVQKMKKFHAKSRDSPTESSPEKPPRRAHKSDSDEQEDAAIAELPRSTQAAWTTNKAISQSLDSDDEVEIPRVLIHQDNTDQYESTLIIAVTRPAPPVPKSTAIIKDITPRIKSRPRSEWIPNKNAISTFLEMTPSPPPCPQHLEISRGHARKRSMDSNDSDSWIPDNFRTKSCTSSAAAGLDKISENTEPWKVHSVFSEKRLYKANSIDIFAHRDGGAFVDFDDELKNVPVRRIAAASADSIEKSIGEGTDDDDDSDNASRITRVKLPEVVTSTKVAIEAIRSDSIKGSVESTKACHGSPPPAKKGQIGNSQESLDANYDENEEISSEDDDEPPNEAPSPPPSFSPPPPPLPLRKPPRMAPERNDSMVRLAHPLVKQASFRRHFSEEIEPSDLGKVNKLICRFEKTPSEESVERVQTIANDNEDDFETEDAKAMKTKDNVAANGNKKRPAPVPKLPDTLKVEDLCNNNEIQVTREDAASPEIVFHKNLDNVSIQSPNSEYGSPVGSMCFSERISTSSEYGSPIGMAYSNRTLDQLQAGRRLSNRSSLRDDDTFYSFESDEENNFYSLGESSSTTMRYTIEI